MNKILNEESYHKNMHKVKNHNSNNKIDFKIPNDDKSQQPSKVSEEKKLLNEEVAKNENYYLSRERALMMDKYGKSMLDLNKDFEIKFLIPLDFLERHSLTPEAREKMVDWMVEVFTANKSEPGTLELAVHIMDTYIANTKKTLKNEDIHLIGLASIYIASKVEEKIPMRLNHIVNNLGKNVFTKDQIIEMEEDIVKATEFDFFTAGNYDYLMVFFYDLKVNNAKLISKYNAKEIVDKFMNFCVFLSKLILYNHEFTTFRTSLVSLAILSLAFDFLKVNDQINDTNLRHMLRDWIYYLINEMKYDPVAVGYVYGRIYDLYKFDISEPQKAFEETNGKNGDEFSNIFKLYQDIVM